MTDCTKTRLMWQSLWTTEGVTNAVAAAAAAKTGEGANLSPSSVSAARGDVDRESRTLKIATSSSESPADGATSATPSGDAGEDHGSKRGVVGGEKKGVGENRRGLEVGGMSPAEVLQQREIERLKNHTRSLERWVVERGVRSDMAGLCTWGDSHGLAGRFMIAFMIAAPLDPFCFIHYVIQK